MLCPSTPSLQPPGRWYCKVWGYFKANFDGPLRHLTLRGCRLLNNCDIWKIPKVLTSLGLGLRFGLGLFFWKFWQEGCYFPLKVPPISWQNAKKQVDFKMKFQPHRPQMFWQNWNISIIKQTPALQSLPSLKVHHSNYSLTVPSFRPPSGPTEQPPGR